MPYTCMVKHTYVVRLGSRASYLAISLQDVLLMLQCYITQHPKVDIKDGGTGMKLVVLTVADSVADEAWSWFTPNQIQIDFGQLPNVSCQTLTSRGQCGTRMCSSSIDCPDICMFRCLVLNRFCPHVHEHTWDLIENTISLSNQPCRLCVRDLYILILVFDYIFRFFPQQPIPTSWNVKLLSDFAWWIWSHSSTLACLSYNNLPLPARTFKQQRLKCDQVCHKSFGIHSKTADLTYKWRISRGMEMVTHLLSTCCPVPRQVHDRRAMDTNKWKRKPSERHTTIRGEVVYPYHLLKIPSWKTADRERKSQVDTKQPPP